MNLSGSLISFVCEVHRTPLQLSNWISYHREREQHIVSHRKGLVAEDKLRQQPHLTNCNYDEAPDQNFTFNSEDTSINSYMCAREELWWIKHLMESGLFVFKGIIWLLIQGRDSICITYNIAVIQPQTHKTMKLYVSDYDSLRRIRSLGPWLWRDPSRGGSAIFTTHYRTCSQEAASKSALFWTSQLRRRSGTICRHVHTREWVTA